MASNERTGALGRLLASLGEAGGSTGQLAEAIEHGDPEQLQHWYALLADVSTKELLGAALDGQLDSEHFQGILGALHLLMQWEHTQGEELKELLERETVGMAEREEQWAAEREALRAELSTQRERITARAGVDNVHEAFRAEIDALSAENAQLKQLGRDRDREVAEQRDRADELEARLQGTERERALLLSNQAQLEESIRELNRRLSTRSEASQRGQEWESRKLRQRNEQALVLSDQVRELAAQNDELRTEVDRLTRALEEATVLLQENGHRFGEFDEQFAEAEKQIERLGTDNRELRALLAEREAELKQRAENVELTNREVAELLQAKETALEKLRAQTNKQKLELEQLRGHLEAAQPVDEQKEAELEKLRLELVAATETARRLFGAAMAEEESSAEGQQQRTELLIGRAEPGGVELRLRLVQMDRELEQCEAQLREEKRATVELEAAMEQKDLQIARLLADCQRYRKLAFGDADAEMRRIEKQLEFRERQIEQLNRRCSELQLEVEGLVEQKEEAKGRDEREEEAEERKEKEAPISRKKKRKKVAIKLEEELLKVGADEEEIAPEAEELVQVEDEIIGGYRIETIGEEEPVEEEGEGRRKISKKKGREVEEEGPMEGEVAKAKSTLKSSLKSRGELLKEATRVNVLHGHISRLIQELEDREKQLEQLEKLHAERGRHLLAAKQAEADVRREMAELREILLFAAVEDGHDPVDRLDEEREEEASSPFAHIRSAERLETLALENMELHRLSDNLAQSGDERERRMAEATRRLLYLAVREAKLERRVQIGKRLRQAMATELDRNRSRLSRVLTGQEAVGRQLALENEAKLFELARLQNALLHSVPLQEYQRLQREHKRMLRDRFLQPDAGYHSATDEEKEADEAANLLGQLDISRAGLLFAGGQQQSGDAVLMRCRRLQEQNDVLSGQNESLRKEQGKLEAELAELNAFLDDLEAETEMKSMLANIERRFVQALREQFEAAEERESVQRELQRVDRNFREARSEWLTERQALVHTIGRLHATLQRLTREQIAQPVPISTAQLEALARRLREMREMETELAGKEAAIATKLEAVELRERADEAKQTAADALAANDWQLEHVQVSLQGYQMNVLTLGAELQKTRKTLEKTQAELRARMEELDELRQTVEDFQFVQGIDLKMLEQRISNSVEGKTKPALKEMASAKRPSSSSAEEDVLQSAPSTSAIPSAAALLVADEDVAIVGIHPERTRVVVLNNSAEWAEQLRQAREQARLCVDSYKLQLEQREKTLEDYRSLVEQLKTELTSRGEAKPAGPKEPSRSREEAEAGRPKNSEELLAEQSRTEQWERRVRTLEVRMRILETENAELDTERMRLAEQFRRLVGKKHRNVQVQVDLLAVGREEGGGQRPKKKKIELGQQQIDKKTRRTEGKKTGGSASSAASSSSSTETEEKEKEEMKKKDEESEKKKEEDEEEEESGNGTPGSSGSDSGTVEDFKQQRNGRRGSRMSSRSNSVGELNRSRSSVGTRTMLPPRVPQQQQGGNELETLVLRHRNETRRLRMRLIELERRNKELSEQYASLRERSRQAARPRSSALPDSAEGALRKENERLQRLNANLRKSAELQKTELEEAQKRLTRAETQSRAGAQLWDERKRHEQAMAGAKRRLTEAEAREAELRTLMERQERHIEQLTREKAAKLADGDRLQAALRHWREEKADLEKQAKTLADERRTLADRCGDLMGRLEALAKENRLVHKRLQSLQQQKERKLTAERGIVASRVEAQTQTVVSPSADIRAAEEAQQRRRAGSRIRSAPASGPSSGRPPPAPPVPPSTQQRSRPEPEDPAARAQQHQQMATKQLEMEWVAKEGGWREENQALAKRLRRAELLQQETAEQLDTLKKAHGQLLEDYNGLVKLGRELELKREANEEMETIGVALLRDKLEARERELDMQRHRILELERQIWQAEMQQRRRK